jgi:hypothetical protein
MAPDARHDVLRTEEWAIIEGAEQPLGVSGSECVGGGVTHCVEEAC